jgi:hypothetical protein
MTAVDEIKERLDIVEVISGVVPLEKSGRRFRGFCPFHDDRNTPSLVVFPAEQCWYCFGACSTGGDVFDFVMKLKGWDFRTALKELARRSGVERLFSLTSHLSCTILINAHIKRPRAFEEPEAKQLRWSCPQAGERLGISIVSRLPPTCQGLHQTKSESVAGFARSPLSTERYRMR